MVPALMRAIMTRRDSDHIMIIRSMTLIKRLEITDGSHLEAIFTSCCPFLPLRSPTHHPIISRRKLISFWIFMNFYSLTIRTTPLINIWRWNLPLDRSDSLSMSSFLLNSSDHASASSSFITKHEILFFSQKLSSFLIFCHDFSTGNIQPDA